MRDNLRELGTLFSSMAFFLFCFLIRKQGAMDSNSSLGPFSFLFVYDLSSIAPSIELLSVLRVARPLQMKHSSLNLGPFFFFL